VGIIVLFVVALFVYSLVDCLIFCIWLDGLFVCGMVVVVVCFMVMLFVCATVGCCLFAWGDLFSLSVFRLGWACRFLVVTLLTCR